MALQLLIQMVKHFKKYEIMNKDIAYLFMPKELVILSCNFETALEKSEYPHDVCVEYQKKFSPFGWEIQHDASGNVYGYKQFPLFNSEFLTQSFNEIREKLLENPLELSIHKNYINENGGGKSSVIDIDLPNGEDITFFYESELDCDLDYLTLIKEISKILP